MNNGHHTANLDTIWYIKTYIAVPHLYIIISYTLIYKCGTVPRTDLSTAICLCDVKHISTFPLKCEQGSHNVKCSIAQVDCQMKCCNGIWVPRDQNLHWSKKKWVCGSEGAGLLNSPSPKSAVHVLWDWLGWRDYTKCFRIIIYHTSKQTWMVSLSRCSLFKILFPTYSLN